MYLEIRPNPIIHINVKKKLYEGNSKKYKKGEHEKKEVKKNGKGVIGIGPRGWPGVKRRGHAKGEFR